MIQLASSWQKVRFDQICKNISNRIDDPKQADTDYYVGLEHLDSEEPKILRHGSPQDVSKTKLLFKPGHILFGKRNWYLRRLAVAEREGICSAHMLVLEPIEGKITKEFLPLLMFSDEFYEKALMVSAGSMSPTIKWKDIAKLEFFIPPIPEQETTIALIHQTNDTIAKTQSLLQQTKIYFVSKCENMLIMGIGHTKFKKVKWVNGKTIEIPEEWNLLCMENIIGRTKHALKRGPWGSSLKKSFFVKHGYKVYQQQNAIYNDLKYGNYYIDDEKFRELKDFEIKPGDFIVSCSGTIGKICQISPKAEKGIINQALLKISLDKKIIDEKFFIMMFQSSEFQSSFTGSSHGSAIKNVISIKQLKQIPILLPSFSEQQKISSILSKINEQISQQQSHLSNLKTMRKSILNSKLTPKMEEKLVAQ